MLFLAIGVVAASIGISVGGNNTVDLGPFSTTVSISPSSAGESEVILPPLGSMVFDSHDGPLRFQVRLDSLDQDRTNELITDPEGVKKAAESVPQDLENGVVNVVLGAIAGSILVGLILGALIFRNMRRTAICGTLSLTLAIGAIGFAGATIRPDSVTEPRYEGLLVNAPAIVGTAQTFASRYEKYRHQLQQFIVNMSQFYTLARTLPAFEPDPGTIRVLHVSDIHLNPASFDLIKSVVKQFKIDVIIDTGDITDWGSDQESKSFRSGVANSGAPYVYIRGNHDSGKTSAAVAEQSNAIVLDDDVVEIEGLRIAGIGDPRFTPDKSSEPTDVREEQILWDVGTQLRNTIDKDGGADIALVHDPRSAPPLIDTVPLILSGHRHVRQVQVMDDDTLLQVQGSTGGAGLRGLQKAEPVPLDLSILYFDDDTKKLAAFDDIAVGGHGETEVTLQRHILNDDGMPDDASDLVPPSDEFLPPNDVPSTEPEDNLSDVGSDLQDVKIIAIDMGLQKFSALLCMNHIRV